MGRSLTVPTVVRRVVSLAPSATEVLYAVGAGALVVGADKYSDFPAAVTTVEKVGADIDPSLERVLALRPDVVFAATTANNQRSVETMERIGLTVYVSHTSTLAEVIADLRQIADVTGHGSEGAQVAAGLEARIAAVHSRVGTAPPTRSLVVVWPEPLTVAGGGSHVDELIRAAGGANVAAASPQPYPNYSLERLLAQAPSVIVVGTHADANLSVPASFRSLTTLPAVRDHRVHALDGDLLFRPGPRVVDGIERLAALLHPELYPAASSTRAASRADGGAP